RSSDLATPRIVPADPATGDDESTSGDHRRPCGRSRSFVEGGAVAGTSDPKTITPARRPNKSEAAGGPHGRAGQIRHPTAARGRRGPLPRRSRRPVPAVELRGRPTDRRADGLPGLTGPAAGRPPPAPPEQRPARGSPARAR